ncbi:integrase arm-type DNA-binding domain-containing protein [Aggregatibacter kilianii]|uniref:integrase arm-type DNA-binding domain-containing protein n=1 Tax=Aggregatibacter kilianii TaxID=2025884 RepID=UPI0028E26C2C|nr:integrase arm-type DNA-binding domain-containing protein [Aggregatibacter kilianii]
MLRVKKHLTDTEIKKVKPKEKEYPFSDGNELILRVKPNGSKIWLFNYYHPVTQKRTNAGLGMYSQIQLAVARAKRKEYRALLAQGIDPQEHKRKVQEAQKNKRSISDGIDLLRYMKYD